MLVQGEYVRENMLVQGRRCKFKGEYVSSREKILV